MVIIVQEHHLKMSLEWMRISSILTWRGVKKRHEWRKRGDTLAEWKTDSNAPSADLFKPPFWCCCETTSPVIGRRAVRIRTNRPRDETVELWIQHENSNNILLLLSRFVHHGSLLLYIMLKYHWNVLWDILLQLFLQQTSDKRSFMFINVY